MNDLEMFARCLLVCCFYGFSAKTMWDHKEAFPYFTKAIENIGGINKFITMLSHLKAPKMIVSLTWDNYFDECPHVRELEIVDPCLITRVLEIVQLMMRNGDLGPNNGRSTALQG